MAKQIISAKIDVDRLAKLDAVAADLGMSRTAAIEAALDTWLNPIADCIAEHGAETFRAVQAAISEQFTLDGEEPEGDPDQPLLDLAAQPPSNPWGI